MRAMGGGKTWTGTSRMTAMGGGKTWTGTSRMRATLMRRENRTGTG